LFGCGPWTTTGRSPTRMPSPAMPKASRKESAITPRRTHSDVTRTTTGASGQSTTLRETRLNRLGPCTGSTRTPARTTTTSSTPAGPPFQDEWLPTALTVRSRTARADMNFPPNRTLAWIAGYLAGNVPHPPDVAWNEDGDEQPEVMQRWEALAEQFRRTGWWPHPEDLDKYYQGRADLPPAPLQFDPDVWWPWAGLGSRKKPLPPYS
jgi:hypothetical protein